MQLLLALATVLFGGGLLLAARIRKTALGRKR
jgi:hypothetical protein